MDMMLHRSNQERGYSRGVTPRTQAGCPRSKSPTRKKQQAPLK
jgi:ribosome modulation factor